MSLSLASPLRHDKILCTTEGIDEKRSGLEATAGCLEALRITVSTGQDVHHRPDLRKGRLGWRLENGTQWSFKKK